MSVEGIPNGWRLVRVGRVCRGEVYVDRHGNPLKWLGSVQGESKDYVIIEMIKDAKQYRQPDLSDLVNGPIEIEACTPDPDTGERRWRQRKLVAIQTESRKPFVVEHPDHRGMVVCYREARIEVSASSESGSPSDLALVNTQVIPQKPLAIPEGWRELNEGEKRLKTDLYGFEGKWCCYIDFDPEGSEMSEYNKGIHYKHIRKIETANASETPNTSLPDPGPGYRLLSKDPPEDLQLRDEVWSKSLSKWVDSSAMYGGKTQSHNDYYRRKIDEPAPQIAQVPDVKVTIYRTPTQADLANGPIRCRVRDSKDHKWIDRTLYAIMPETVSGRFVTITEDQRHVGSWVYCEIIGYSKTIAVGDLVRLTARPIGVGREGWVHAMNNHVGKITKVLGITDDGRLLLEGCGGWRFHPDWVEIVDDKASESAKGGEA